ncbi:MAG: alpha/beta fold hydrolase [Pseudomonadota bacterium]
MDKTSEEIEPASGFSFPDPGVFERFSLPVGDGHTLNVELSGKGDGVPIVFCHGGPGGLIGDHVRCYGDPDKVLLVQIDQRGCGRSTPLGETQANTLDHLVEDMEKVRAHLSLERWTVAGGSWGVTLAIRYGQLHPDRTAGLILRGGFLGDASGFEWFDKTMHHIFPDAFEIFANATGCGQDESIYDATEKHVLGDDLEKARQAALALTLYEERCASLDPPENLDDAFDADECLNGIRIALHYRKHQAFLPPNGILGDMNILADTPGILVHGRYDIVCPFGNAVKLKRVWPQADLVLCPHAGHLGTEPELAQAMTRAFQKAERW